jgi:hypothetical protein
MLLFFSSGFFSSGCFSSGYFSSGFLARVLVFMFSALKL